MENIYDYLPGIKARPGLTVDSGSGHAAFGVHLTRRC